MGRGRRGHHTGAAILWAPRALAVDLVLVGFDSSIRARDRVGRGHDLLAGLDFSRARWNTARIISGVRRPVKVFCWLG